MLPPSIGTAIPVRRINGSMAAASVAHETAHVRQLAGAGGGRCHGRAHQVGARAGALAADEVAVRGRGAALLRAHRVPVDGRAHGAAGVAPFEASFLEYAV